MSYTLRFNSSFETRQYMTIHVQPDASTGPRLIGYNYSSAVYSIAIMSYTFHRTYSHGFMSIARKGGGIFAIYP